MLSADLLARRFDKVDNWRVTVKPVSEARFAKTMQRLVKRLRATSSARDDTIVVPTARGATVLALKEIDWIEAADNYARLWVGGRSYLLRESLRTLEPRARAHGFIRAHRRALVRLGGVRELMSTDAGAMVVLLGCGARVRVSRRQRSAFVAALKARAG